MANELTAERVAVLAAAARVHLDTATAARVARTVSPTVGQFSTPDIVVPFEIEPATFVVVQHRDARR
jgi:ABC-type ATPase with predicted acetyltransferase domain